MRGSCIRRPTFLLGPPSLATLAETSITEFQRIFAPEFLMVLIKGQLIEYKV